MLVNLPYAYDDLFLPRMGSLTFAGRPCSTPAGGRGGGVGGMLPLYWKAPPKRGMVVTRMDTPKSGIRSETGTE